MRYTSLDFLRGLSVMGMILFHANYLLEYVFDRDIIPVADGVWRILGPVVAVGFISLAGLASTLSNREKPFSSLVKTSLRRALLIGILALSVSLVTYAIIPEQRISWGILHFFALSTLLGIFSLRGGYITLLIGVGFLIFPYLPLPSPHSLLLIPLGYPPQDYYSADYYPLIPWFGYYLIGQGIGCLFAKYHLLSFLDWGISPSSLFIFLGRHALMFYVVHVPILYGVMWMILR